MKIIHSIKIYISIVAVSLCGILPVYAILGNTVEQNAAVFSSSNIKQKFNFNGDKNVYTYFKDNISITVIYRNDISILEEIAYKQPVEQGQAERDIKDFSLPKTISGPVFSSSMIYLDGYFKENLYKGNIKTKVIINHDGKATDIISSFSRSN